MDKLWAPWRITYIKAKKAKKCIFCAGDKKYRVFEGDYSSCVLNIFPYNNGHLMIYPHRHVRGLYQLKEFEILDIFKSLNKAKRLLDLALKPQGYNIGINLSEVAGAGIAGHLHIHIVPRWKGDTNFMPVLGNTKVISQSLDELVKILKRVGKNND